jgi:hypothetical protein
MTSDAMRSSTSAGDRGVRGRELRVDRGDDDVARAGLSAAPCDHHGIAAVSAVRLAFAFS